MLHDSPQVAHAVVREEGPFRRGSPCMHSYRENLEDKGHNSPFVTRLGTCGSIQ
jgi:hypothetical protein